MSVRRQATAMLLGGALLAGCTGGDDEAQPSPSEAPVVQLGAPGQPNRVLTDQEIAELQRPATLSEADVRFVQSMIPHHAQALEMTGLVASRSDREDISQLSLRMEVSQRDEITLMEDWLRDRDQEIPGAGEHGHSLSAEAGELMPGMLTDEEFAELEAASGTEFDQLFLQYMIRHHQGALQMVADLLASEDGGQAPEVNQLALHIDADQRIEISRMDQLLAQLASAGS